jgi:hypothetical protein
VKLLLERLTQIPLSQQAKASTQEGGAVFCSRKPNTNDKAHFVLFDIFSAGTDETPVFSSPDRSSASGFCCLLFKMTW